MSVERIQELEKRMSVAEATVELTIPPLLDRMDKSTEAMNKLTGEISVLVSSNTHMQKVQDEAKVESKALTNRVRIIENKDAVRDSKAQVFLWIERVFWTGLAAALLKQAGII